MSYYYKSKRAKEELDKRPSSMWFFTLNNYSNEHIHRIIAMADDWFYVVGKEVGASGNEHLQGVVWRKDDMKFDLKTMSQLIPNSHLERVKHLNNSIGYCLKEGNVLTNTVDNLPHFLQALRVHIQFSQCTDWLYGFWLNYLPSNTYTRPEVTNFWNMHRFNHH